MSNVADSHVIASPRMLGLSNLSDVWRVLKEADLNKLRREAERPFQMLLVAEDVGAAERLGVLLSGPETTRHPWLLPADPAETLRELMELHERGVVTDSELEALRARMGV